MRFGRLTAISQADRKDKWGKTYWLCKCDCGQTVVVKTVSLRRANTRSCGCLAKDTSKSKIQSKIAGARILFNNYKSHSKRRRHTFNLTFERFIELTSANCHYCDAPPSLIAAGWLHHGYTERGVAHSKYIYNGIDRFDNSLDYFDENCVTACRDCNIAKAMRTPSEFLAWAKRVVAHAERK